MDGFQEAQSVRMKVVSGLHTLQLKMMSGDIELADAHREFTELMLEGWASILVEAGPEVVEMGDTIVEYQCTRGDERGDQE